MQSPPIHTPHPNPHSHKNLRAFVPSCENLPPPHPQAPSHPNPLSPNQNREMINAAF